MSKQKPQLNKNGIEINKHLSLSLLQVMGADDPFEGKKFDPQFDDVVGGVMCDNRAKG